MEAQDRNKKIALAGVVYAIVMFAGFAFLPGKISWIVCVGGGMLLGLFVSQLPRPDGGRQRNRNRQR